jgi:S-adenosylmethionine synthetase
MIVVEPCQGKPVSERRVEVVERKGVGHPDTICDSVMEAVSVALVREYRRVARRVLHYNLDKGLLSAGRTEKRFGGGRVRRPMTLMMGDRATFEAGGVRIAVEDIVIAAAKEWFRENLRGVDPERHVRYRVALAPGSAELTDIFARAGAVRPANDTSALVGYWPLSPLEETVLATERYLNSPGFKAVFPETGEDVKVMGVRTGKHVDLTVAMPLLAGAISSERQYFARKADVRSRVEKYLRRFRRHFGRVSLELNALDVPGRGLGGIYLSLLGTSAEDADSGQVGRGNRANGLITPGRPMCMEAAAGKNCVSHVGKIYNVLAHRAARSICREVDGVREAAVTLVSRIGSPVDEPVVAAARVRPGPGRRFRDLKMPVKAVLEREFARMPRFCRKLCAGRFPVC